jgi:hypothetical protein
MWFYIILGILLLVLVAYLMREKKPDLDEAGIIMRDYNEAWAQYKETKGDEDYRKYQARKTAYETHRDLKKKK